MAQKDLGGINKLGMPPTMGALGREGAQLADHLIAEAKINVEALLNIPDQLLKQAIKSKDLFLPPKGVPDGYAQLRQGAQPAPALA